MKPLGHLLIIMAAVIGGCTSPSQVEEEPAIVIAKREVLQKWGWRKVEVNSADFVEGRWIIRLTMLPETPGGHVTVWVSPDGRVTDLRIGR